MKPHTFSGFKSAMRSRKFVTVAGRGREGASLYVGRIQSVQRLNMLNCAVLMLDSRGREHLVIT